MYRFLFLFLLSLITSTSYAQQYVIVADPNAVILSIENERENAGGIIGKVVDLRASVPGHRSIVLCTHYRKVMSSKKDFLESILNQARIDELMVVISKDENSCADWSEETIQISDLRINSVAK